MVPFWPFHSLHRNNEQLKQHQQIGRDNPVFELDGTDDDCDSMSSRSLSSSSHSHSSFKSCRSSSSSLNLSVSFCPQVCQVDYIHLTDISQEEKSKTWYTRQELRQSKRKQNQNAYRKNMFFQMGSTSNLRKVVEDKIWKPREVLNHIKYKHKEAQSNQKGILGTTTSFVEGQCSAGTESEVTEKKND